ncbi:hypothetical protein [Clostridium ihumii]|uniref:hypothetical protein n=1 Tax=Clostridium ihumii TaxID=1470356 RepID=UPI003D34896E
MKTDMSHIKEEYKSALEKFVEKVRRDSNIIAAFSYGSITNDKLWEKSDIDIWLISKENRKNIYKQYSLVEDDIDFQVELYSRNYFIELVDISQNQNFFRTVLNKSNLLFSNDDTIENLFNEDKLLGYREKEENILKSAVYAIICIKKAEKVLILEEDIVDGFNLIEKLVYNIACIEIALHNEFRDREVVSQALNLNPDFLNCTYVSLIKNEVTILSLVKILEICKEYIEEKKDILFHPIVKWMKDVGEVRGVSIINEYLKKKYNINNDGNELIDTYNWLAERDVLIKTSESIKLIDKSKIIFEEAAYYYNFGSDI